MDYKKLRTIDVSPFIEKKGGLNYISWSNSLDLLLQHDPMATWVFHDVIYYAETAMVGVTLNAFGKSIQMQLPVLAGNNKPISNPNAFDINRAQMRVLTKAISAGTGIGLVQLYSGDDLPPDEDDAEDYIQAMKLCATHEELHGVYTQAYKAVKKDKELLKLVTKAKDERKQEIAGN